VGAARAAVRWLVDRPVALTSLWALVCALAVEAAPVVGGDLAAQAWWRSWATAGVPPVDLGWYGGVPVVSYSVAGPWIAGALGLPLMGVLGTVLGAAATTALLARLHPPPKRLVVAGVVAQPICENEENGAISPLFERTYHCERSSGRARYCASPCT
jgi:hypothetical protein